MRMLIEITWNSGWKAIKSGWR